MVWRLGRCSYDLRGLPAWLSVLDVARWFGCSRATVFNWLAQGRFVRPRRLSARMTRWRRADPVVRRLLLRGPAAVGKFKGQRSG